jgi:Cu-Zn family superoxide dismutase
MVGWHRAGRAAGYVNNLAPGVHGVHIHAVGACSPTFTTSGRHHNPLAHEHGLDNANGPHAGDLPNLIVNVAGIGHLDATTDRSDARIACAVIDEG